MDGRKIQINVPVFLFIIMMKLVRGHGSVQDLFLLLQAVVVVVVLDLMEEIVVVIWEETIEEDPQ